jgi:hypothetical protein
MSDEQGTGGTFLRFTVGARGVSGAHLRYISRPGATLERDGKGFSQCITQNLPEYFDAVQSREELRAFLGVYAEAREGEETIGRTHYRCLMSFEKEVESDRVCHLARQWLKETFPEARAAGFVHQNTAHTHIHLWIDARQTNGKKIDIRPHVYRRLDEVWNRLYARAFDRDENEHLRKKAMPKNQPRQKLIYEPKPMTYEPNRNVRANRVPRGVTSHSKRAGGSARGDDTEPEGSHPKATAGEHPAVALSSSHNQATRTTESAIRAVAETQSAIDRLCRAAQRLHREQASRSPDGLER